MDYVSANEVTKALRGRLVLDDISFSVPKGAIAGIMGSNGSGKSMLFRAIASLVKIDSGSISVDGKEVSRRKPYPVNLGIMLDSSGYWEELSGLKNLEALASIRKLVGEEEVKEALRSVGLDPSDKRPTSSYSAGMRQRLAIAQAIMEHPDLLILDEPTNALDKHGAILIKEVITSQARRGATVLVSCHNQPQLEELFDCCITLSEGRISDWGQSHDGV
ncbi:MAG: ATP-binding cassette domain-containing protein [Coriobacteriaceae bacterium]|uniref:ABC transporter ATP-binding protein n=1 Tax=Tractidigestivibacter sp. TaxID=2847320 RepID=UPI002A9094EE|nr:ATP-binding cassette domain-containing protein [Tractidigestivibacter sp.]MCI6548274.1 ATP-binding cassette domain-containing protein [Coriobacteriaceae bacterium]MDY5271894.1 ATP-binding cassette domain-containing protein [Tractidigestivibacter sp.]